MNDNRDYQYKNGFIENRPEYPCVLSYIDQGASVIDLACGEGSLALKMIAEKQATVKGIEFSTSGVEVCKDRGLDVVQGRIDEVIAFEDKTFDIALCNVTIQMLMYPEVALNEMKRLAKKSIVLSFPNFAYILNRFELLFKGRMPRKMLYGYHWYSTGHIHQLSLSDLKQLVEETGGLDIVEYKVVPSGHRWLDTLAGYWPNLFGKVFVIKLAIHE